MSLLTRGTEVVTVYPEELTIDGYGNKITRASTDGVVCRAVVQPISSTEDQSVGFLSEERLRLRLVGWQGGILGAQSQVEWNGKRYSVDGDAKQYNGSRRTAHVDYTLIRR